MSKITKSAKGEECQFRIPNVCNFNPETTVFCHLGGAGIGMKANDIHGGYGCSDCHDAIDGRKKTVFSQLELQAAFADGMVRTQIILIKKGLIKVA